MPAQSTTTTKRGLPYNYIHGGDAVFSVENTIFRVHRFFFIRDSSWFQERLPYPLPPGDTTEGSSDKHPLILTDVSKTDFERLLWVFYNPKYSVYDASIEEWTSILKLAHRWDFVEVKELAVNGLESFQSRLPALQKAVLYQKYEVDRVRLQAAYTALTVRDDPITIEEGRELGLETAVQLARAREFARAPSFSDKRVANPRSPVNLSGDELHTLINSIFQLSSSGAGSEHTTQPPTGSGTPTDTRDTPQTERTQTNSGSSTSNPQGTGTHAIGTTSVTNGPSNGNVNGTNNSNTRSNAGGRR